MSANTERLERMAVEAAKLADDWLQDAKWNRERGYEETAGAREKIAERSKQDAEWYRSLIPLVEAGEAQWRTDMENAPLDTPLAVRAGDMTFDASLQLLDNGDQEPTYGWVAEHEGIHPRCWTDGRRWARNENDEPSAPVTHWQPLPPEPNGGVE